VGSIPSESQMQNSSTKAAGIEKRKKRVAEIIAKELTKANPGAWGCVQTRAMWSTDEQVHLRPGHHWLF